VAVVPAAHLFARLVIEDLEQLADLCLAPIHQRLQRIANVGRGIHV
jgi:hypothetical protein